MGFSSLVRFHFSFLVSDFMAVLQSACVSWINRIFWDEAKGRMPHVVFFVPFVSNTYGKKFSDVFTRILDLGRGKLCAGFYYCTF